MIVFTIIPNVYLGMWIVLGLAMLGLAMYFIFTKTEHYNLELKNIMLGVIILFLSVSTLMLKKRSAKRIIYVANQFYHK